MTFVDTEYERAKVSPYKANDPPPSPGNLEALLFPPLVNKVQNKVTQGYDAELPPFISNVRHPGRPVILGTKICRRILEYVNGVFQAGFCNLVSGGVGYGAGWRGVGEGLGKGWAGLGRRWGGVGEGLGKGWGGLGLLYFKHSV